MPDCGSPLAPSAAFCPGCGGRVAPSQSPDAYQPSPPRRRRRRAVIAGLLVGLVLVVVVVGRLRHREQGLWVDFVDGVASEPVEFTPEPAVLDATSPVSPTALDRGMTPMDVADALQAAPEPLEPVPTPFGDLGAEAFADVGLVVVYLDGYFYTAQTM